jgi:hypothetical protein
MADNAVVTWAATREPWLWEERALGAFDLPLNLSGSSQHQFHAALAPHLSSCDAMPPLLG